MAGLFGGAEAPQYVGTDGQAVATKTSSGLLGLFPGAPDYVPAPVVTPPTPTLPPANVVPPVMPQVPTVELMVRIPGLLNLQGALALPPWLLESAPVLLPLMVQILRHRVAVACGPAPERGEDPAIYAPEDGCDPVCERPETEQRVWDRE